MCSRVRERHCPGRDRSDRQDDEIQGRRPLDDIETRLRRKRPHRRCSFAGGRRPPTLRRCAFRWPLLPAIPRRVSRSGSAKGATSVSPIRSSGSYPGCSPRSLQRVLPRGWDGEHGGTCASSPGHGLHAHCFGVDSGLDRLPRPPQRVQCYHALLPDHEWSNADGMAPLVESGHLAGCRRSVLG